MKLTIGQKTWLFRVLDKVYPHIARMNVFGKQRLLTYYWCRDRNFGDILNEYLFEKCEAPIKRVESPFADYYCIGSILERALREPPWPVAGRALHVFGSGFICPQVAEERFRRPMVFHAVRGEMTRERCAAATGEDLSGVPMGDPGLMVPRLFPRIRRKTTTTIGIVAHLADRNNPLLKGIKFDRYPHILINLDSKPTVVLEQLAHCGAVLSTALHPLICSDALGIPNLHIVVGNGLLGGDYKFRDYNSVFSNRAHRFVRMGDVPIDDRLVERVMDEYQSRQDEAESIATSLQNALPKEFRFRL